VWGNTLSLYLITSRETAMLAKLYVKLVLMRKTASMVYFRHCRVYCGTWADIIPTEQAIN
jgi:hypothetical protein